MFSAQDGIGDRLYAVPYRHDTPEGRPPRVSAGKRRTLDVRAPGGGRFIQVSDPALSPDGRELAFVGVAADGQQDLYLVPLAGREARRLTNDPYSEKDLSWGPDGIFFASDATDHGRTNLFRISPQTAERVRLTTGPTSDRHPSALPDGSVLYSSDAGGKLDLYLLKDGATKQITDFSTGLVSPTLSPKGRGVYAGTFYGGTFRLVEVPKVSWLESPPTSVPPAAGDVLEIPTADLPQEAEYNALSAKNWSPEAGFVYGGGAGNAVAGRAAVLFSDMLRDHVLFLDLSVYGSFDYTQGLAMYENRSQRLGWILGGFHYVQQNLDRLDPNLVYFQRDFGVLGALRYPLDRFRRVEAELTLGGVQRYCLEDFVGDFSRCGGVVTPRPNGVYPDTDAWKRQNGGVNFTVSPTLRFGYDTIRYDYATGPLAGHSLLAEVGGGWLPGRERGPRVRPRGRAAVLPALAPRQPRVPGRRGDLLRARPARPDLGAVVVAHLRGQPARLRRARLREPHRLELLGRERRAAGAARLARAARDLRLRRGRRGPRLRRRLRPLDDAAPGGRDLAPPGRGRLGRADPDRRARRERPVRPAPPARPLRPPLLDRRHRDPGARRGAGWVTNVTLRYFFM